MTTKDPHITDALLSGGISDGVEASMLKKAADNLANKGMNISDWAGDLRVAFSGGGVSTKITTIGGAVAGATLIIRGIRDIRMGIKKNTEGKRDILQALLGVGEITGGGITAAIFYERLKLDVIPRDTSENSR